MVQALNAALRHSLAQDPRVLVFGEDVGTLGGVFRVTSKLASEFGSNRCFDTPIAEAGILGMSIGMAAYGLRPVVEIQFDAFSYASFEQVASHLAKMRNRSRGAWPMPVVVRIPYGGGIGAVEHHSDSSEACFAHTPGLLVVTPATVEDAYGLLCQAIASDDPVIFYEPKSLYWESASITLPVEVPPLGKAIIRRTGSDATLITYGPALRVCLDAAKFAAEDGYDIGVVDLRSLVPFDEDTVVSELMRTKRAVVVHEAGGFGGFGAEIVARLTERCFQSLKAPILRVTGLSIPYPPPHLEKEHLPSAQRIIDALAEIV
jgi:pyruvate dehydrogenase E1 component beta subunit